MKNLGTIQNDGMARENWHVRTYGGKRLVPVLGMGELEPDRTYDAACGCAFETIGVIDGYDNVTSRIDLATICDDHIDWLRCHYPNLVDSCSSHAGSQAHREFAITAIILLFGKGLVSFFVEYIPSKYEMGGK